MARVKGGPKPPKAPLPQRRRVQWPPPPLPQRAPAPGQRVMVPVQRHAPWPPLPPQVPVAAPLVQQAVLPPPKDDAVKFECCICMERLDAKAGTVPEEGDEDAADPSEIVATMCGHMFHKLCLDEWMYTKKKTTCPTCREPVDDNDDFLAPVPLFPTASSDATKKTGDASKPVQGAQDGDLQAIHETLRKDYEELQAEYNDLKEKYDIDQARLNSYVEEDLRKERKIRGLKRALKSATEAAEEEKEEEEEEEEEEGPAKPKKEKK